MQLQMYKLRLAMREKEFLPLIKDKLGIAELNEMQFEALRKGSGVARLMILAPTGTGKTLAYILPVLKNLKSPNGRLQAMVMTPTRELTIQSADMIRKIASGYKVTALYGAHKIEDEINSLSVTPDIIVATPGRLLDHIRRRTSDFRTTRILVLDEFDKILELGFEKEMKKVVEHLVNVSRIILTSATLPEALPGYIRGDFEKISRLEDRKELRGRMRIRRVDSDEKDKIPTLAYLLCGIMPAGQEKTVVFVNYRESAERVRESLEKRGIYAGLYHGALQQNERENAIEMFSNGSLPILIATDLAARGLDFPSVANIIHYHQPSTPEAFIHRNGRTARVNSEGNVYVIIGPEEDIKIPDEFDDTYFPTREKLEIPMPLYRTLSISAGKKEKLSKGDIVGFLINKAGILPDRIGRIFTGDHYSLAAIPREDAGNILKAISGEKVKGEKRKFHLME